MTRVEEVDTWPVEPFHTGRLREQTRKSVSEMKSGFTYRASRASTGSEDHYDVKKQLISQSATAVSITTHGKLNTQEKKPSALFRN